MLTLIELAAGGLSKYNVIVLSVVGSHVVMKEVYGAEASLVTTTKSLVDKP